MIRVVGTAGHVDHGKSALVEALTGTHPDRLREEREREMTIDLGFAWLTLADGTEVGIVDVPGHRDFIDNMLAGAGGVHAALLVVAADEGVMPQTREHLAILNLLQVPRLLVALTKMDTIDDVAWAELVEEDVRRLLAGTAYAESAVVRVSARTGEGLDRLRAGLAEVLRALPEPRNLTRPRLPIDRAFVMSGFGTVVTGTLLDGDLEVGQEVQVLPGEVRGRIRGLQTHRRTVERAAAGSRVAVNLTGVDVHQVARGQVVCLAGTYGPTHRIDASLQLLANAPVPVRHGQSLKFHLGTADVIAKVRVLEADEIAPGGEGWVQFVLENPIVAADGDRFILRRPTPPATIGGGVVVASHPARAHRRKDPRVIASLEQMRHGSLADRVLLALASGGPASAGELAERLELRAPVVGDALGELVAEGRAFEFPAISVAADAIYVAAQWWAGVTGKARGLLEAYHMAHPLRLGMPREEFRSRLRMSPRYKERVTAGLIHQGVLTGEGSRVALAGFEPRLSREDDRRLSELRSRFQAAPTSPPSIRECRELVGDELWNLLTTQGEFVEVSQDVVFDATTYDRLVGEIRNQLERGEAVTVAAIRDRYQTSRKYALSLLEHLDAQGITVRVGDERRLRESGTQTSGSGLG